MDKRDRSGRYEVRCAMKARAPVTDFSLQLEHRDWLTFRYETCAFEHIVGWEDDETLEHPPRYLRQTCISAHRSRTK
jgi:hypothetical protein